jgi:integrase
MEGAMSKLSDVVIRNWIRAGERFEARGDGQGLYLRFRESDSAPRWLFRYQLAGQARKVDLGSYKTVSLADARRSAREFKARVALGYDVAAEKLDRKKESAARIEAERNAVTVATLADEYLAERIIGRWKHPNIVRGRIERDIKPAIGHLALAEVRPSHVADLLKSIVKRGAPTMATDVLRWLKRMFDYAIKRELMLTNPAAAFDPSDAGGKEEARDRWLTNTELSRLLAAMKVAKGWTYQNTLTLKLLLMLAVRKSELIEAPIKEFDLDSGVWRLPEERTKTGEALDIPLPRQAVTALRELVRLAGQSAWLLPARKMQTRMVPHIDLNTIGAAIAKNIRPLLGADFKPFVVHDFRRTARTHLESLGVVPHIAERCLNHKLRGVVGVYNRYDYFEERSTALQLWADRLEELEVGDVGVSAGKKRPRAA